jgi:glucose-6-phosphate dehydrogenase assembly protein OpcA
MPDGSHALESLFQITDRLIVDSAAFPDQLVELRRLAAFAAKEPATGFGDLSWDRLATWRQMLQQQQQIAEMRHHLSSVEGIEVQYSARDGKRLPAQALFFLASLAGELGWEVTGVRKLGQGHLSLSHHGRTIDLIVQPVDHPAIDPGCLTSVKITCRSDSAQAVLHVSQGRDPQRVTIRAEHRGTVTESLVLIPDTDTRTALARELDKLPRDPGFGLVLSRAVPLMVAWDA